MEIGEVLFGGVGGGGVEYQKKRDKLGSLGLLLMSLHARKGDALRLAWQQAGWLALLVLSSAIKLALSLSVHSRDVLRVAELLAGVHGERSRALAEADALGAVLAAVAHLAVERLLVLSDGRGVEQLVAHC